MSECLNKFPTKLYWFVLLLLLSSVSAIFGQSNQQNQLMNFEVSLSRSESAGNYAIVIANANYQERHSGYLPGPLEDSIRLQKLLMMRLGYLEENIFQIGDENQPDKYDIINEVESIAREIPQGSNILIYYAGHGVTLSGFAENYIVPIGVNPPDPNATNFERQFADKLVSLETLIASVKEIAKPKSLVVFYNACRSGANDNLFMGSSATATNFPSEISGTMVFFSAARGQQALSGRIVNDVELPTVYGGVLLDILDSNPTLQLEQLQLLLSVRVKEQAREATTGLIGHLQNPVSFNRLELPEERIIKGSCLAQVEVNGELTCTNIKFQPIDVQISDQRPVAVEPVTITTAFIDNPDQLITALQQELANHNCAPGPVDGIFGFKSATAIMLFNRGSSGSCAPLETLPPIGRGSADQSFINIANENLTRLQNCARPACGQATPIGYSRDFQSLCLYYVDNSSNLDPGQFAEWSGSCDAQGFASGQGVLTFSYPSANTPDHYVASYSGGMCAGQYCGSGVRLQLNDLVYDGEWQDGKRHGNGTMTFSDGAHYEGEWRDGEKHGHGRFQYADGGVYVGQFQSGKRSGQGTMAYDDGDHYEGAWRDGKIHGHGRYQFANGKVYVGQLQSGRVWGQGTMTYADGAHYDGEFRDGRKHGNGTMTYVDGDYYVGKWNAGVFHGQGRYYHRNGDYHNETWVNGVRQ